MKSIRLGDLAPNFRAKSTEGEINFHDWLGNSWGILFSHPADYTPVCTTELGAIAKCKAEFDKRNVKILALSEDSLESHRGGLKILMRLNAQLLIFLSLQTKIEKLQFCMI